MWWNDELFAKMYVQSIENQSFELQRARERNAELSQRCRKLEEEKEVLDGKLKLNQVAVVTEKNDLNSLQERLMKQKRIIMELTQRLRVSNEHIDMVQSCINKMTNQHVDSLSILEPMHEKLSFKSNVVECLEKKLIETRLQTAEQEVTIAQLECYKKGLTADIDAIKSIQPNSISKLQEEFLEARIQEADVILEFDKIKRTLVTLKNDVQEQLKETEKELSGTLDDFFSIRFNLRDKYQDKIKSQNEDSLTNIVKLQDEVDHLKMQVKNLENMRDDINNQIYLNEEIKVHLYSVRTSIYQRNQKINNELEDLTKKKITFEEIGNYDLEDIQNNIEDKSNTVSELLEKIDTLQRKNEDNFELNAQTQETRNVNTIEDLQGEIKRLQNQIQSLSLEGI